MVNLYKEYVDKLYTSYFVAYLEFDDAQTDINSAWVYWGQNNWQRTTQRTLWAVQHILDGALCIIGRGEEPADKNYLDKALVKAWQYTTEEFPEVTYKAICEAWGKDDFEGRAVTIAFIDRMRQLIWGEPYFVAWAAKPEEEF